MPLPEEQKDPTWELLKKARRTEPSPFFSRNVVREIRRLEAERGLLATWLERFTFLRRPLVLASGLAAVALILSAVALLPRTPPPGAGPVAEADTPAPAEVLASETDYDPASEVGNLEYLGQLMAVADPAALDDAALADLLF